MKRKYLIMLLTTFILAMGFSVTAQAFDGYCQLNGRMAQACEKIAE